MAGKEDDASKEFDPTPRKLEKARKKGDIPKSTDANIAAAYLGLLVAILAAGAWMAQGFGSVLVAFLDRPHELTSAFFESRTRRTSGALLTGLVWTLAPIFSLPPALVVLSLVAQRGIAFAPSKLMPKASRISPIENAKNKFGWNGLFEFAKSGTKLVIFSLVLGVFLSANADGIIASMALPIAGFGAYLAGLLANFMFIVLVIAASIAAIDTMWQHAEHRRKNRMTRKEIQDEAKESEGDPHLKQERRQRGQEIAMQRMIADVPGADVVIVNPSHFAVALQWDRLPGTAPTCVAKGVDHTAARIREAAIEAGVPIHRDPPTARAIFAHTDLGQEIRPQDYRAVAAAIRFAEDMVRRSKWISESV